MATLYKPVDVLTKDQAATPGVLHIEDDGHGRAIWLVPVEVEEETRASWVRVGTIAAHETPDGIA